MSISLGANTVFLVLACTASGASAFVLGRYIYDVVRVRGAVTARRGSALAERVGVDGGGIALLLGVAHTLERAGESQDSHIRRQVPSTQDIRLVEEAHLSGLLEPGQLPALRTRIGVLIGAGLALIALLQGVPFALLALALGVIAGRKFVDAVLKKRASEIREQCENELPGMLDIVSLAVRAGMSFDSALAIYCKGSRGELAKLCSQSQAEYLHGAKGRAQALRDLTKTLAIPAFGRFTSTVIQALHFGAPLAPALHLLSEEVRSAHRAKVSERIAKAPVKMLVPMALLILPAMLLLVLGPIVLNMLQEMS